MDFRKYGVDIPPRIDELKEDTKRLLYAKESLQLSDKKKCEQLPQRIIDTEEVSNY